ncbi:MAG: site-specific DNA-methyltransferase [Rhodomicrobium sp.]
MVLSMSDDALHYGDNLSVLRECVADESVDLIYLDPPFNSNATYNVLFKAPGGEESQAQIEAFGDTWHWDEAAEDAFDQVMRSPNSDTASMLRAMRSFLHENDMMAYLSMMAVRLLELHRVLKPRGSLYLHCDPTASHYIKSLLDAVFGPRNMGAEIIWKRTSAHNDAKQGRRDYGRVHDTIFYFRKGEQYLWNVQYSPYEEEYTTSMYKHIEEETGRRYGLFDLSGPGGKSKGNPQFEFLGVTRFWRFTREKMEALLSEGRIVQKAPGSVPRQKRYLDEMPGVALQDLWTDIPPLSSQSKERLGYPTQKPVALLERIISASSNEGDLVLDPFCGCGTTVHAAQKLNRRWVGIDITHLAIDLIENRLRNAFPGVQFKVYGVPQDLDGARNLASRDKYEFQKWIVAKAGGKPYQSGKKGMDRGIDGYVRFQDAGKKWQHGVISVKGDERVEPAMVRDLKGTMERDKAELGLFLTLTRPSKEMIKEAASAGFYETGGQRVPRVQILTAEDLIGGKKPQTPFGFAEGYKAAAEEDQASEKQGRLL